MTDQDPQNPIQPEQPQPTEQPTEDTEVFYGRQALVLAKQLSVDVVWKTETGEPVDIETAKALIASQGPNAVFFDFEALATLPEVQDEIETAVEQTDPYMAQLPLPPDETLAGQQVPPGMMQSSQSVPGQQYVDPISDRERMAFGNVLTTPGQTVYIRPNVIRVEVEGNVRVQKGRQGNVRMMRIVRLDPSGSERVADAFRTTVQAPMVRSPNPAVTYRQSQAVMQDRVPVPKPKVPVPNVNKNSGIADAFEEFDF